METNEINFLLLEFLYVNYVLFTYVCISVHMSIQMYKCANFIQDETYNTVHVFFIFIPLLSVTTRCMDGKNNNAYARTDTTVQIFSGTLNISITRIRQCVTSIEHSFNSRSITCPLKRARLLFCTYIQYTYCSSV